MKTKTRMPSAQRIQGFTLIEFLVASALAMIVIVAAGSTYFITRKLNHTSLERMDLQQNLRNASVNITRDAREAGTFGCYSLGNNENIVTGWQKPDFTSVNSNNILIDTDRNDGFGIRQGNFNYNGQNLPALFFVYGKGQTGIQSITDLGKTGGTPTTITLANNTQNNEDLDELRQTLSGGGPIAISSCSYAVAKTGTPVSGNRLSISFGNSPQKGFTEEESGRMVLSKVYSSAYFVHDKQLLRVDLGNNGTWRQPQLISNGINSMSVGFGYADDCPTGFNGATAPGAAAADPDETFTFSNTLNAQKLPAIIQIRLNYDLDIPTVDANGKTVPVTNPTTADYILNATVRGGNICANRIPF